MRFESYHPTINFLYFSVAIAAALLFRHPVYLAISFVCAFLYSVKRNGLRSLLFNIVLLFLAGVDALWYAYYNHFGVTELTTNFIDNVITLEALVYGMVRAVSIITVLMILTSVFSVVSSDKVVYLFGRVSPRLSLFFSILLRGIPRIGERAGRIELSRSGIGKGLGQGHIGERIRHLIALISITITWTLEDFVDSAASMKSRGYSLKGRTAFSIYRFDNRDRAIVLLLFFCFTAMFTGFLLNQTNISYDPQIVVNRITWVSVVFYLLYALFCLLPAMLEWVAAIKGRCQ